MPFKVHLIIVTCIIAIVYMIWQFMHATPLIKTTDNSHGIPHMIAVTHASFGLNCRNLAINNDTLPHDAFNAGKSSNAKLADDNVFSAISLKCNGATECEVALDDPILGDDPAPGCSPKTLEIEYRCFSYDRPWRVLATSGSVKLLCTNNPNK